MDNKYSIRPCPYGCSASALRPDNLKLKKDTKDPPASATLWIASLIMAMEPIRKPMINSPKQTNTFTTIPVILAIIPYCWRTLVSLTPSLFFTNKRINTSVILHLFYLFNIYSQFYPILICYITEVAFYSHLLSHYILLFNYYQL